MTKTQSSWAFLSLLATLPAHAAAVTMPDGANHQLRFDWNADVENQWLILAPRAPAVIQGTERVARTGLANAQRRQSEVRSTLMLGDTAAEGGVWARVGGEFGQQDSGNIRVAALSRPISGLPLPGGGTQPDIDNTSDLLDYTFASLEARLPSEYTARYQNQAWYQALDPAERAAVVAAAVEQHLAAVPNLDYDEQISHFNVGADFISGTRAEGAWIAGGAIGYVRASQEFDDFKYMNQGSKFDWDSVNLGAYASYVKGKAYVDTAVSYAWHSIDLDMPVLGMVPAGAMINTDGQSLALSVEAGWRIDLKQALYIEPQLAAIWVLSDLKDAQVQRADALTFNEQFNTLSYGDPKSQRVGLGAELGHDWKRGSLTLTGTFAARYWLELDRESEVELLTPATRVNTTVANDLGVVTQVALPLLEAKEASGYTQLTLGGHLRNDENRLLGGLALDYLTGGDFDSYGFTASFRYQW